MSEFEYEPDSPECAALDSLFDALANGDVPALVQSLRALETLDPLASRSAMGLLADVFADIKSLRGLFPRRLGFVKKRGKPLTDRMRKGAVWFSIARAVEDELPNSAKVESAVERVSVRFKISKATVYAALRKVRENKEVSSN